MPTPDQIIAAAQAILPELPVLLSPESAAEYDRQIRTLLAQIDENQAQPTQLSALLRQSDTTRQWIQRFLQGEAQADITRSFLGLPGDSSPQPAVKYGCPRCAHTWYREDTSAIPLCPTHLVPLMPAQS